MARIKPNTRKIKNIDEANDALIDIAHAEMQLEFIDNEANSKILAIKEASVKEGTPLRERIKELSAMLGSFAEYNKDELFTNKKSVEVAAGVIGYRKSTKIIIRKTTTELLEQLGMHRFLTVKTTANKEAMRELSDDELLKVNATRKESDAFFCESDREQINKELLK